MHMSFWWDFKINNFLFWGYNIPSLAVFTLTCCGLLLLGFAFEWIKILQAKVRHSGFHMAHARPLCPGESDALLTNNQEPSTSVQQQITTLPLPNKRHRLFYFTTDFILWQVQQLLGYLLMLTVMVYNGYMMIAIVLGYGLGYFLFYPSIMRINIENYKIMQCASLCRAECVEQENSALLPSTVVETTTAPCHASTSTTNTIISEVI